MSMFRDSETLALISRHMLVEPTDGHPVNFPFDLEKFCNEMDLKIVELKALIEIAIKDAERFSEHLTPTGVTWLKRAREVLKTGREDLQ